MESTEPDYKRRIDMIRMTTALMAAIVVCFSVLFVVPASAQPSTGSTLQDSESQHHRMMYQKMKDMTDQMGQMTEQMARGEPSPEQRKQMAGRMELMSAMMRRMSWLAGRPSMKPAEQKKQMDLMSKQMDEMHGSKMAPAGK
jgi:hypothetical protein